MTKGITPHSLRSVIVAHILERTGAVLPDSAFVSVHISFKGPTHSATAEALVPTSRWRETQTRSGLIVNELQGTVGENLSSLYVSIDLPAMALTPTGVPTK